MRCDLRCGKNDTDGAGAGVAADGGTDVRLDDLLELAVLCKPGLDGLQTAGFGLAGGEEDDTGIDVVSVSQLLGDVFAHADGKLTAVLLDHLQLAVDDGQTGLDAQNVGPEGQHTGAAATLGHVVQLVEHEAQIDLLGKGLQPHTDVPGRQAVRRELGCPQDEIALPGADVLAIHDRDVPELLRGEFCVLAAGRELGPDTDVDDGIVVFSKDLLIKVKP